MTGLSSADGRDQASPWRRGAFDGATDLEAGDMHEHRMQALRMLGAPAPRTCRSYSAPRRGGHLDLPVVHVAALGRDVSRAWFMHQHEEVHANVHVKSAAWPAICGADWRRRSWRPSDRRRAEHPLRSEFVDQPARRSPEIAL